MNSSLRREQDLGPAAVQERYTDSKHSRSSDDTPVLLACKGRKGAGREAGLVEGTALACHLLGWHCCGGKCEAAKS